jgi:hypothetical protein
VAEHLSKRVSKRHSAKYLDIGYSRYSTHSPKAVRGFLNRIGGGASHLGMPRERHDGPVSPFGGKTERTRTRL